MQFLKDDVQTVVSWVMAFDSMPPPTIWGGGLLCHFPYSISPDHTRTDPFLDFIKQYVW